MSATHTVVLMRHGESTWNVENRFTGWVDVDLSPTGCAEARAAGALLKQQGYTFDVAYTSVLKRAIRTLWLSLEAMDMLWLPMIKDWRLNERHYGALQGLNKAETAKKFGDEQVLLWRRSYDMQPPPLGQPMADLPIAAYPGLSLDTLPRCECLKDTVARVVPYWQSDIVPVIKSGKKVLISAHGNSLRALMKHVDNIADDKIVELNIPNGKPLVYKFDAAMRPLERFYL